MLVHRATGMVGQAGERRSQAENRRVALRRLRLVLAVAVRTAPPGGWAGGAGGPDGAGVGGGAGGAATARAPSPLWRSRCRDGRISCNPSHEDFPALLAEAMDALTAAGWEPRPAGAALACTPTQIVRLLGDHPPALAAANAARASRGLHPLR